MPTGMINRLVHLSQQTYQPNSRLISGHNDKGYGTIEDAGGREVYFSHDAVPGIHGFDDLRRGQVVQYTLEEGPYLRAKNVEETTAAAASVQNPAVSLHGEER